MRVKDAKPYGSWCMVSFVEKVGLDGLMEKPVEVPFEPEPEPEPEAEGGGGRKAL